MLYKLIMFDWLRLYLYYDANEKLVSYVFILFGARLHKGDVTGAISKHYFISLYKYTRLIQESDGDSTFTHIPLLEVLLGMTLEHDAIKPKYSKVHSVGDVEYILNIYDRYSYFSKVGKLITFNEKETYQVISPIGDCLTETFSPPSWTERPHPNVIINQAKTIKDLIDKFTIN